MEQKILFFSGEVSFNHQQEQAINNKKNKKTNLLQRRP